MELSLSGTKVLESESSSIQQEAKLTWC